MISSLFVVTALALINFMVFMVLVIILIRARRRYQDSSFRITPAQDDLEGTEINVEASVLFDDSEVPNDIKSTSHEPGTDSEISLDEKRSEKHGRPRQEVSVG
jgi:hypothetical protein